jgi:exosortase
MTTQPSSAVPTTSAADPRRRRSLCAALVVVVAVLLWAYWPALGSLWHRWSTDSRYSHGYIVPVLALTVWWVRRRSHPVAALHPSWWGVPVIVAGVALRLAGAYFYLDWFDGLSLLPVLAGIALSIGGWPLCRQTGPAIAVLFFMVPLPYQVEGALSVPLQRLGTVASTYALQTLGLPAISEGNVILIDDLRLGVLEACNGLGMLSAFFAISATVALVIRRSLQDKVVIFLSAIPIGVLMNLLRLTGTGLVYATVGSQAAQAFFHDLAGWLMMPLALATLALELYVLSRLFVVVDPAGPHPVVVAPRTARSLNDSPALWPGPARPAASAGKG